MGIVTCHQQISLEKNKNKTKHAKKPIMGTLYTQIYIHNNDDKSYFKLPKVWSDMRKEQHKHVTQSN